MPAERLILIVLRENLFVLSVAVFDCNRWGIPNAGDPSRGIIILRNLEMFLMQARYCKILLLRAHSCFYEKGEEKWLRKANIQNAAEESMRFCKHF